MLTHDSDSETQSLFLMHIVAKPVCKHQFVNVLCHAAAHSALTSCFDCYCLAGQTTVLLQEVRQKLACVFFLQPQCDRKLSSPQLRRKQTLGLFSSSSVL